MSGETRKDAKINAEKREIAFEEKYKRARADYINLERRVKEQQEEFVKFANSVLVLKLLPVLDDLEKAAATEKDSGVNLVLKNLQEVLKSEGVEDIKVKVGDKFDPHKMECTVAEGGGEEIEVSEILRRGYKIKDKILRSVQVSTKSKAPSSK